jgi:hypothetical protein
LRDLRESLLELIEPHAPVTVRQAFYLAVSAGLIPKTEQAYKNSVVGQLADMRRDGELPFDSIADNTRWMRKPRTYKNLEEALRQTAQFYRRSLWREQDEYVEIWLEQDALAGVLYDVTATWDVPLMVTRGYPSLSFLYGAAEAIKAQEKPTFIYYFGDWDPSGVDIPRFVEESLEELTGEADIAFIREAVEPWQIDRWHLPTRPTKTSDSRSKNFTGESVEVDAIPPDQLRQIVNGCIESHVDEEQLRVTRVAEASERELLRLLNPSTITRLRETT